MERGQGSGGERPRYNTAITGVPIRMPNSSSAIRIRRYDQLQQIREDMLAAGCSAQALAEVEQEIHELVRAQIGCVRMENRLYRRMLAMEKAHTTRHATKDNFYADVLPVITQASEEAAKYEELFDCQAWPWPGINQFSFQRFSTPLQVLACQTASLEEDEGTGQTGPSGSGGPRQL